MLVKIQTFVENWRYICIYFDIKKLNIINLSYMNLYQSLPTVSDLQCPAYKIFWRCGEEKWMGFES